MAERILRPARAVKERYGVSDMTLWRWVKDPDLGFPQPIKINRRNYWPEDALVEFERRQAGRGRAA